MNAGTPAQGAMDAEVQASALLDGLVGAKHRLGLLCAYWAARSPGLELNIALANVAQEEEGHALVLETLLHEDDGRPAPERDRLVSWDNWSTVGPARTVIPQEWPAALAELLWLDGLATAALQALIRAGSQRLVDRVRKMLQEEGFHRLFELETARTVAGPASGARLMSVLEQARRRLEGEFGLAAAVGAVVAAGLLPDEALAAHDAYLAALERDLAHALGDPGHAC